MIKFDELTLGEVEEIELLLDGSIEEAFADGKPKGRALRVIYFIAKRKEDPNYKFEDTVNVSQKEAVALLTGDTAKKE
jgi:hypothetical protein